MTDKITRYLNALRFLSIDAVNKANSGHPGMPMGMAEIATVLWKEHLSHSPEHPNWANRDRFVLSNGHGSMLLYSLLHLSGYDLSIDDLKNFRQLNSKTPGHPEAHLTPGVETTTGPLGQGIGNAVGMALAEKLLSAEFNREHFKILDHYTYSFLGDGCLMEGISHEVCSLAGVWQLGKLICFYDDNGISIDGKVEAWFQDDTAQRFASYHWQVIGPIDGHDLTAIKQAILKAKANTSQPSLIICKTIIGKGSPGKQNSAGVHGSPLGQTEADRTREQLNWPLAPFEISDDIKHYWDSRPAGRKLYHKWQDLFAAYSKKYPPLASSFLRRIKGELPSDWDDFCAKSLQQINQQQAAMATRKASQKVLDQLTAKLPEMLGGSADLTGSNLTKGAAVSAFSPENLSGRYLHYGVREFGMASIMNGLASYGGFLPFGGTFLTFCDYLKPALRLSALMQLRVIYVLTHDSIGLGEDGPTHQPIEHASSLRLTPNVDLWRPCDTVETFAAWKQALENKTGPSALLLSRQSLPFITRSVSSQANVSRGGYLIAEAKSACQLVLIATGSEVSLALKAHEALDQKGIATQVVSMPSCYQFDRQPLEYRQAVLPPKLPKLAIEAGSSAFWYKYVGEKGRVLGIDRFGESAPAEDLFKHFEFTVEKIIILAQDLL